MNERQLRIFTHPELARLVAERRRFAWALTVLVLGSFFTYLMVGILRPSWLAIPVAEGSLITLGYPLGATLVLMAWISTGIYIRRAGQEFDPRCAQILSEATK